MTISLLDNVCSKLASLVLTATIFVTVSGCQGAKENPPSPAPASSSQNATESGSGAGSATEPGKIETTENENAGRGERPIDPAKFTPR